MSFKGTALKDLCEQVGEKGALTIIREGLEKGEVKPESLSLREIRESVSTSMFPVITGAVISAAVTDSYKNTPAIGDKLTETIQSDHKVEKVPGISAADTPQEVLEGTEYSESELSEKYFESTNVKYGRLISVTEEMVRFDQTKTILTRARSIGQKGALYKERLILRAVMDLDGKSYVPDGTSQALYSAANLNLISSNPYGDSGLRAAMEVLHKMKDENDDPILVDQGNLIGLFPIGLYLTSLETVNSELQSEAVGQARNIWRGAFTPLTSPYVTRESSTTWFIGDFKKQFKWLEVIGLEVLEQVPNSGDLFTRDLAARFKVRFFGSCTSTDTRYVLKCTA